jgi:hypothetical protein
MTAEPLPLALAVRRPPWSDRMVVTDAGSTCFETEKLKALLRKVAARTIEALIAAIAEALTKVSSQECESYRRQL